MKTTFCGFLNRWVYPINGTFSGQLPQDGPMSLKLTLLSQGVCEKAALPLFLEYPAKVQRIIQSQGGTGAAQRPAHIPGQEQLGVQNTSLATAGYRECTMPSCIISSPQSSTSPYFPNYLTVGSWLLPTVPLRSGISILLPRHWHKDQHHQWQLKWE